MFKRVQLQLSQNAGYYITALVPGARQREEEERERLEEAEELGMLSEFLAGFWGLGLRVQGLGLRVSGLGFPILEGPKPHTLPRGTSVGTRKGM